jgi:hypothetical protein
MLKKELIRNTGLLLIIFGCIMMVYAFYASHAAPAPSIVIKPSTKMLNSLMSQTGPVLTFTGIGIVLVLWLQKVTKRN